MTTKIRRSSGNVFRDLGFPADEATNLKLRSDLMIRLSKLIDARGLTQAQAAMLFGVMVAEWRQVERGRILGERALHDVVDDAPERVLRERVPRVEQ